MFLDQKYRAASYHDSWMSLDPVLGCPYDCTYCVLSNWGLNKCRPVIKKTPGECVAALLEHRFFTPGNTKIAIGNETDMFHPLNTGYLLEILRQLSAGNISNPIILITKAPLHEGILEKISSIPGLNVILFLSYSGLGSEYEPSFTPGQFRRNFILARSYRFPVVHFWRPLLPVNSSVEAVDNMLEFVSGYAMATVFIGLKIHPGLAKITGNKKKFPLPPGVLDSPGEWMAPGTVETVYSRGKCTVPQYPVFRHTSCALSYILKQPDYTATVYRKDICPGSQCPESQRRMCEQAKNIPTDDQVTEILARLDRKIDYSVKKNCVKLHGSVCQEEFSFILHHLNFPIKPQSVKMVNIYKGSIYDGWDIS